jgi:hypothetical protein
MKKHRRPIQRSLDELVPRPIAMDRVAQLLVGEPFVSPVARIPVNRTLLMPEKPR